MSNSIAAILGRRPRRSVAGGDMPLVAHLDELRSRLIICLIAVVAGAAVGFMLWNRVLDVATTPYCKALAARGVQQAAGAKACQLYITDPLQLITTRLSVSAYLGLFFACPVVLWQIWRFVTPGLNGNEKRYAIPFVGSSVLLFGLGAWVAWLTFPRTISFFLAVGGNHILTLFNPSPYLKLIFLMMLIFGLVFKLPLLLISLELTGVVSSRKLRDWRRYAIVTNFAVAAVITPSQDPYSMCAMAIPMCIFYEIAIATGRVLKK